MGHSEPSSPNPRVAALMWNLRIDAATGELVRALRARAVESVVLKGRSLTDWYPPDSGRTYVDGDIWVSPADGAAAEATLAELGFVPEIDERGLPEWWQEHASSWQRERDHVKIDLHRRLQGVNADPAEVWALLHARGLAMQVGGVEALRLDDVAQALYVTLHATHHGARDARGLPHLRAALAVADDATWSEALELATELDALEAFSTGLRLLPDSAALATRLGVPDARSVRTELLASTPPPVALGFDQLASARGLRRGQILLRKLVPPPGFVRHWWPPAARSRPMLALGYLYRPVWLLQHAPAGYRAWREARRAASSSS